MSKAAACQSERAKKKKRERGRRTIVRGSPTIPTATATTAYDSRSGLLSLPQLLLSLQLLFLRLLLCNRKHGRTDDEEKLFYFYFLMH